MDLRRHLYVSSSPYETRAALLENGEVVEIQLERARSRGIAGNIYKGRVRKVLPGMQSAFVDVGLDKDAFLYVTDVLEADGAPGDGASGSDSNAIERRLQQGQELLVQIAKEPIAGKGARITAHVTLPGRYLVYMPTVGHVGVSRRVEDPDERARLKLIVEGLRDGGPGGFIVRTVGTGEDADEFRADAQFLRDLWKAVCQRMEQAPTPSLVHRELNLLERLLRDLVAGDFGEILVDSESDYDRSREFLSRIRPELVDKVRLYVGDEPMFDANGIEAEIQKALRSRVWLKSGGYIVINQTEALVAVDVNTGRYVGKVCLEDTAMRTNLEAAKELVRQIRLRDLGGIIVVDFIDMEKAENREILVECLESELRRDRSRTKLLKISDFGLVEMTRKRVKGSLERTLSRPCRECGGSGRVKTPETVCYEIHRQMRKDRESLRRLATVELRVHPEVSELFRGSEHELVTSLERELGVKISVAADPSLHVEHYHLGQES